VLEPQAAKAPSTEAQPRIRYGNHSEKPSFQVKQSQLNFMGNIFN
jgi:hypothetical protein